MYEENRVSDVFTFLAHENLVRYIEFDIMRGAYNIKILASGFGSVS